MPVDMATAWNFFSDPRNLQEITGGGMDFKIISAHHGEKMYAGQLIEYTLKPILGISLYWMTEITHVQPQQFFVDDQRFGPYSFWHHKHFFEATPKGTKMTDVVHYGLPLGFLGRIMNALIVKNKLKSIFEHRRVIIDEMFNSK